MSKISKFIPIKCEIVATEYFRVWFDRRNFATYLITPNQYWGDGVHPDSKQYIQAATVEPGKFEFSTTGSRAHPDINDNCVLHIKPKSSIIGKIKEAFNV